MNRAIYMKIVFSAVLVFTAGFLFGESGQVNFLLGKAEVLTSTGTKKVKLNDVISEGTTLRTMAGATCILLFPDGTEIKVKEKTEIKLSKVSSDKIEVNMDRGGVISHFKKKSGVNSGLQILTPTATIGVRGTIFFVAALQNENVWMCVKEGLVEVKENSTGSIQNVPEGKGVNIVPGAQVEEPKSYEWTKNINWNMDGEVLDKTDLESNYVDPLRFDYE